MTATPATERSFAPHILIVVLLLWALIPANPYGYYSVMRWVVCAAFIYLAVSAYGQSQKKWVWLWGVAAGIYNPFFPVHATREFWSLINVASVGLVACAVLTGHKPMNGPEKLKYIQGAIQPLKSVPRLGQFYGIGKMVLGRLSDSDWKDSYSIQQAFLTFLFIPVIPLRFYFIRQDGNDHTYYGAVPFRSVFHCHSPLELLRFYAVTFAKGFFPLLTLAITLIVLFFALDFAISRWG